MPSALPPTTPLRPQLKSLAPGAVVWRLHRSSRAPTEFNATLRDGHRTFQPLTDQGGRFDAITGDPYGYLYAAADTAGATAEALLRDRPAATPGFLRRAKAAGLVLSCLDLCDTLVIAVLHGPGLTAISQDAWVTACGPDQYGLTREWASAIRRWAPTASGLEWRARLDNDRLAYVFFADRCPTNAFTIRHSYAIDPARPSIGLRLVQTALKKHGVTFY
ncbi:MAG TPA: RES domain-containing protein [Anaeromyxobacteraceae bacterium]|nr:RES domain-containing protein [Anaeromyxobacteraceae bacterium]